MSELTDPPFDIRTVWRGRHPWYGPCDSLGPNGECAECLKQGAPDRSSAIERLEQAIDEWSVLVGLGRISDRLSLGFKQHFARVIEQAEGAERERIRQMLAEPSVELVERTQSAIHSAGALASDGCLSEQQVIIVALRAVAALIAEGK